jgi:hypothetical protein
MINKTTAFRLAHAFARQISIEDGLRAKLRHAADMLSYPDQAAADRFVDEQLAEFIDEHSAWLENNQ